MSSKIIFGFFVGTILISLPNSAKAGPYEDLMAKLEFCRDLETPEKRLQCFEFLVPQGEVELSLTPSMRLSPLLNLRDPEPESEEITDPNSNVIPEVKTLIPALKPTPQPETEQEKPTRNPAEFGSEHLKETPQEKAQEEESSTFTYTVSRTEENRNKLIYFYMENGQVWRQLERQRLFLPKDRNFEVVITKGSFGDFKMRIEGKGRQNRVKRVK